MNKRLVVVPVLLAAVAGGAWWFTRDGEEADPRRLKLSGTVEATDAQLGFRVPGRIAEVLVREGDEVAAGAALARLDAAEATARRDQAAAQVEAARARLAELEAGSRREEVAEARAAGDAARERQADARRDLERARQLFAGGALPKEAADKAQAALDVATAQRAQAEERLRLVEAGPRRERIAAARAEVAVAAAALAAAEVTLADTRLDAPFAGVVTVRHRQPGEIVGAGAAVVTLLDPADRWVRVYVPEDRLAAVPLGAAATIAADADPGRRYPGEVSYLASEAEFTPKTVQTPEERVRLVFAAKVRITADPARDLKPGLPVDVEVALP